jgi:hypothetical protein
MIGGGWLIYYLLSFCCLADFFVLVSSPATYFLLFTDSLSFTLALLLSASPDFKGYLCFFSL